MNQYHDDPSVFYAIGNLIAMASLHGGFLHRVEFPIGKDKVPFQFEVINSKWSEDFGFLFLRQFEVLIDRNIQRFIFVNYSDADHSRITSLNIFAVDHCACPEMNLISDWYCDRDGDQMNGGKTNPKI